MGLITTFWQKEKTTIYRDQIKELICLLTGYGKRRNGKLKSNNLGAKQNINSGTMNQQRC